MLFNKKEEAVFHATSKLESTTPCQEKNILHSITTHFYTLCRILFYMADYNWLFVNIIWTFFFFFVTRILPYKIIVAKCVLKCMVLALLFFISEKAVSCY